MNETVVATCPDCGGHLADTWDDDAGECSRCGFAYVRDASSALPGVRVVGTLAEAINGAETEHVVVLPQLWTWSFNAGAASLLVALLTFHAGGSPVALSALGAVLLWIGLFGDFAVQLARVARALIRNGGGGGGGSA